MTFRELTQKWIDLNLPLDWKIKLTTQTDTVDVIGLHVIGQHEVGLVLEDHQRVAYLPEDPEEYEIPVAN